MSWAPGGASSSSSGSTSRSWIDHVGPAPAARPRAGSAGPDHRARHRPARPSRLHRRTGRSFPRRHREPLAQVAPAGLVQQVPRHRPGRGHRAWVPSAVWRITTTPSADAIMAVSSDRRRPGTGPDGIGPDRQRAPSAQLGQERPLRPARSGPTAGRRWRPARRGSGRRRPGTRRPAPLGRPGAASARARAPGRPSHRAGTNPAGRWPPWPPPRRRRAGAHGREPGGQVAPESGEGEIGSQIGQLHPTAGRAGGHHRPGGQVVERSRRPGGHADRPARGPPPAPVPAPSAPSEAGRSLAECTAASASRRTTAACTSLTKTPWPPRSSRGTSRRRSRPSPRAPGTT